MVHKQWTDLKQLSWSATKNLHAHTSLKDFYSELS